ncbi:GTPase HflX [Candidatus Similichlamydia laticola]|uniref:GTPase HflX n=1 Tax=Candidatus Similichlamydia laticola TaxID=2170265 RepID=A0A369KA92_9BACT|nr:GTPase HflX [Candidatus Similichlamydia laticola]RDB31521.1 GTP-binding protein HflX [Candidatus Similichlamydia laticola]
MEERKRALTVGLFDPRGGTRLDAEDCLAELGELLRSCDIEVVDKTICPLRERSASTLIGSGRLRDLVVATGEWSVDLVVFDEELTPAQQRNLEKAIGKPVLDRTEVILEVFASKARTHEAKVQVQLAQIRYSMPRLKRLWCHLSRQKGGGVNQKGEGETQIELDRRLLRKSAQRLTEQLEAIQMDRKVLQKQRERSGIFHFALIGYTNAGKSTLMNRLTGSSVYVEDKLFATLDTTTRRLLLSSKQEVLVTDTVGFIRKLPHTLVAAFRSTLEGSLEADCLIHVIDGSHPSFRQHMAATHDVLSSLSKNEKRPVLVVFNKRDIFEDQVAKYQEEFPDALFCSVKQDQGIDLLLHKMEVYASRAHQVIWLSIPPNRYDLVAKLHSLGAIRKQTVDQEGIHHLYVSLSEEQEALYKDFLLS